MTQRSVLITGCSSGIGLDAARSLKARGWRVFAACRKAEDCARLREEGFDSPLIDYQDAETIRSGLDAVLAATGGRLDALFNNGAYALPGAIEDLPTDGLREIYEANVFGWHDLTRLVVPVMRAQGAGRIVNCSSVLGLVTMRYRGAYSSTKHALEGLSDALRLELDGSGIAVSLIEPGPITTRIRENARAPFEKWIDWENSAHRPVYEKSLRPRLYKDYSKDPFELGPEAVTRKLIHALESPRPKPRYFVTVPTYLMATLRRLLPNRLLDRVLRRT